MENDLVRRAFAAYYRSGGTYQPANYSGVRTAGGHHYVVLESGNRMYAVYRVRNDGKLKSLKRWPKALAA